MNILGKRNKSHGSVDSKAKKENNINISINGNDFNDLVRRYKKLAREVKDLNNKLKELTNKVSQVTHK